MIDYLKSKTVDNAGFEIKNRGDCQLLSALIIEKTNGEINYNTLRRLFGLAKYVKPSKNTLDTLARFNGFTDYVHFLTINPFEAYWIEKEKLYGIINEESRIIIDFLNQIDLKSKDTLDIIISLCRELIYLNKIDELDEVLKSEFFNKLEFNYSELLYFGNSIGILFQKNKATKKILLNTNFLNNVYCIFVDYTQLNGYYGEWSKFIIETNSNKQITSFSLAIQQLKNYLNKEPVAYTDFISIDSSKFHPILRGRLYSIKILSEKLSFEDISLNFDEILRQDSQEIFWDYFYELIFTAILSKDFLLMAAIINTLSKHKKNSTYYQEQNQKIYQLMCKYYNYWVNYEALKEISIDESVLIKLEYKYSYNEFIQLFVTVLNYHYNKKNKDQHLKSFLIISKNLNYPLFSKNYLLNYFD